LVKVYHPFQVEAFLKSTMDETWDGLELKERVYKVTINLGKYLPADYASAIGIIDQVVMNYGSWLEGIWCFRFRFLQRRRHPGVHSVTLIVNGVERVKLDFKLDIKTVFVTLPPHERTR